MVSSSKGVEVWLDHSGFQPFNCLQVSYTCTSLTVIVCQFRQFRMYLPRKTVATEAHHSFLSARLSSAADLTSFIR